MAHLNTLRLGGVGLIILIVIIVVIIVIRNASDNSPSSSNGSSDWADRRRRKHKTDRRYRVKGVIQDEERFEVEHGRHTHKKKHHHRRKNSSSSSSSSSDSHHHHDDSIFLPGGLGAQCDVNQAPCSQGLACEGGRCVCPRPISPIVTAIEQGVSEIVVTWNNVPTATYYELILLQDGFDGPTPVRVVRALRNATTFTFTDLPPSNYTIEVRSGSDQCGIASGSPAGSAKVIGVGCDSNDECAALNPATPTCQAGVCVGTTTLTGQGIAQACTADNNCSAGLTCSNGECICPQPGPVANVTLTPGTEPNSLVAIWPASARATVYQVTLFQLSLTTALETRLPPIRRISSPTTTATFTNLTPGASYFVEVVAGSASCGISTTDATTTSPTTLLPLQACTGPPPGPAAMPFVISDVIVDGQREVTLSWGRVATANRYLVIVRPAPLFPGTPLQPPLFSEFEVATSITFLFTPGSYEVRVHSVSTECGTDLTSFALFTFTILP